MRWNKKLMSLALALILMLGCVFPVHASEGYVSTAPDPPSVPTEPAPSEVPTQPTEPDEGPITPEGNVTLVDDVIDPATGMEFITIVTKNGNYFYIIIERDDKGNRNVHFLNMVDERDLLELLSEEEVQDYQDQQTAEPTVPAETTPAPTEPMAPTEPEDPFDPQMDRETMILLAVPIVVLIVGGFAAYFIFSRKKPKATSKAQHDDEDWDIDYDLPEEDDDEPNANNF